MIATKRAYNKGARRASLSRGAGVRTNAGAFMRCALSGAMLLAILFAAAPAWPREPQRSDATAVASNASLSGEVAVTGQDGNNPLPGIEVKVTGPAGTVSQTAVTDDKGHYEFNGLKAGVYTLTISQQGFEAV